MIWIGVSTHGYLNFTCLQYFNYFFQRSKQLAKSGVGLSEPPRATTSKKDSNKKDSNKNKKEGRVNKMVLVMILVFLVVWSPYAIAVIATVAKVCSPVPVRLYTLEIKIV